MDYRAEIGGEVTEADQAWARAFARQALSDLDARELLTDAAKCHRVHYLQMAAEKVCKASVILENGRAAIGNSHAVIERYLPAIARAYLRQRSKSSRNLQVRRIRQLAREIELLSPALGRNEGRLDNCEYPWQDFRLGIQTPCLHSFPNLDDRDKACVIVLKLLRTAAESYAR